MAADAGPLLSQVRRRSEEAAARRRLEGKAEAEQLLAAADARAAARRTAALAERSLAAERALQQARAEVGQRVSREVMGARAEALERIFARATAQVETLSGHPALGAMLTEALRDAVTYLPEGPVRVRCPPALGALVRAALPGVPLEVREEPGARVGAIAESADGAVSVDVTLARMLARRRPQLSVALVAQIERAAP